MFVIEEREVFNGIYQPWKRTNLVAETFEQAVWMKPSNTNEVNGYRKEYRINEL